MSGELLIGVRKRSTSPPLHNTGIGDQNTSTGINACFDFLFVRIVFQVTLTYLAEMNVLPNLLILLIICFICEDGIYITVTKERPELSIHLSYEL